MFLLEYFVFNQHKLKLCEFNSKIFTFASALSLSLSFLVGGMGHRPGPLQEAP